MSMSVFGRINLVKGNYCSQDALYFIHATSNFSSQPLEIEYCYRELCVARHKNQDLTILNYMQLNKVEA